MSNGAGSLVRAAGCVVWRYGSDEPEVLVVHRPRWDDWSFPKGKLEPGEDCIAAAVREVEEETGLRVRVGPRLRDDHYTISSGQPKTVSYWIAQPPRNADITHYKANAEVDNVAWMSLTQARSQLSYARDVDLLHEFTVSAYDSQVLLVVRHAEARKRKTWEGEDAARPLAPEGRRTAEGLVAVLAAYGVTRVVTSDALRCVETMRPFVKAYDVKTRVKPALSEEEAAGPALAEVATKALLRHKRMAICTHRPVLPPLCAALGIEKTSLEPGGMIVIHRSAGKVLSVEKPG